MTFSDNDIQCNDIQYNDVQYNDIQYNDSQYNDIQYNDIQNSNMHRSIKLACLEKIRYFYHGTLTKGKVSVLLTS